MEERHIGADPGSEAPDRELQQALAQLPENRSTPLDGFLIVTLLKENVLTRQQVLESIDACRLSLEPRTLFETMRSRGEIEDSHVDMLLKLYKQQMLQKKSADDIADVAFGEIAIQKNLASHEDLWEAIGEQERGRAAGSERRLGEILVGRGTLTVEQAKDILSSQGKRILKCPGCGEQYNVTNYSPEREYSCLSCGSRLSDTGEVLTLEVRGTATEKTISVQQTKAKDRFIGREISGCKIVSKVGKGGMGTVYKAHHQRLNRTVAVKIMAPGLLGETHYKRFLREARAAAELDHPNIMVVHDVDELEGSPYIIMQYIDGKSVGDILDAKRKFPEREALRIILGAAEALDAAHERKIVHRDIKPDNIMLTQSGQVKVMDFGLAKHTGPEDMGVTASGVILGTPVYMSPEQFNAEVLDGRSDIYSLGVTLYHMVAGRAPFSGKTPYELRDKHMRTKPPSPKTYSPNLSPATCAIIERMLAKKKEDRYLSAAELVADLKAALGGPGAMVAAPAKRKGLFKFVIPAAVAAAIVVALALLLRPGGPPPSTPALEERASQEYKKLTPQVEQKKEAKQYHEALELLNGFPAHFAATQAFKQVESDKVHLLELINEYLMGKLREVNQKITDDDIATAKNLSNTLTEQALRIKFRISAMDKTGAVGKPAEQAEKQVAQIELTNKEIPIFKDARDRFNALVSAERPGEARNLLDSLALQNSGLDNLVQELIESLKDDTKLREKRRWRTAEKQARSLMAVNDFKQADEIITSDNFEQSKVAQVATEAKGLRNEIAQKYRLYVEHIEGEINTAGKLASQWKLKEARELLLKYRNEEEFKDRIEKLLLTVDQRQRYLKVSGDAEKLIRSHRRTDARDLLAPWLEDSDPEIAARADELFKKVRYPEMVYFPAAQYTLTDSRPVSLNAFYIDAYEVTNKLYADFLKSTKHAPPEGWNAGAPSNLPVSGVSYADAAAYAKWVGKRLPSQEEWEVGASWDPQAARALTYPWGDTFEPANCNLATSGPSPAGSRPADLSPCGVFDMAGNVCEWTQTTEHGYHVVRGGSWADTLPEAARAGAHFSLHPKTRSSRLGFRCARDAK